MKYLNHINENLLLDSNCLRYVILHAFLKKATPFFNSTSVLLNFFMN